MNSVFTLRTQNSLENILSSLSYEGRAESRAASYMLYTCTQALKAASVFRLLGKRNTFWLYDAWNVVILLATAVGAVKKPRLNKLVCLLGFGDPVRAGHLSPLGFRSHISPQSARGGCQAFVTKAAPWGNRTLRSKRVEARAAAPSASSTHEWPQHYISNCFY